ncbi:DUF2946 family protein [Janthinobacterium fluminis]|uniref:DUF2946 family protein n=1 Tax=Janthinobacterium fluminis TaxID=2987524 RepID=A0ABT5K568_9BURK|nr:DUF2946 family protein [Janthinobacterium fluminis]MDC8760128.1 DUF2946 family protein [Janthinobacterium fluminis]
MAKSFTVRRLHIWIACLAILLNALAPSISHAVAAARGQAAALDICRADGRRAIASDVIAGDAADAAGDAAAKAGGHCAYCLPHAASFALPPAPAATPGVFDRHQPHPFLLYRSPRPSMVWSAARPRGPPAPV